MTSYGTNYEPETLENPDETTLNNESISCTLIVSADDESMLEIEPDKMPSTLRSGISRKVMTRERDEPLGSPPIMPEHLLEDINKIRIGVSGVAIAIVLAFTLAWGVMQFGPFEMARDHNRDIQEATQARQDIRQQRQDDQAHMNDQLSEINHKLENLAESERATHDQVMHLSDQLQYPVPSAPTVRK